MIRMADKCNNVSFLKGYNVKELKYIKSDDHFELLIENKNKEFIVNLGKRLKEVLYLYIGVGQKYILETFEIHVNEIEKNKLFRS